MVGSVQQQSHDVFTSLTYRPAVVKRWVAECRGVAAFDDDITAFYDRGEEAGRRSLTLELDPMQDLVIGRAGLLVIDMQRGFIDDDAGSYVIDAEREMCRVLAAARDEVPANVSVTTQLLHGACARAIAKLAKCGDYDVVVTPRTSTRLRRLLRAT